MRLTLGLAACVLSACAWGSPGSGGRASTAPDSGSVVQPSVLAGRIGEPLELSVPVFGGGQLSLAELRGRAVLLELADRGWPGRDAAHDRYRMLLAEHPQAISVVTVALDLQAAELPAAWTDDPPPFVLSWDPQGAVAARLQVVSLPTVVLLDPAGTVVSVHEGATADDASVQRWLQSSAEAEMVADITPRR